MVQSSGHGGGGVLRVIGRDGSAVHAVAVTELGERVGEVGEGVGRSRLAIGGQSGPVRAVAAPHELHSFALVDPTLPTDVEHALWSREAA